MPLTIHSLIVATRKAACGEVSDASRARKTALMTEGERKWGRPFFERLVERPQAVGELARSLPVSRPAVSQHLRVLKEARLVVARQAGKQQIYRVDPYGLAALRAELDRFWTKTLTAYKAAVERPTEEE
jgi:DNA-binding transcriptional ArsR family regulator